MYKTKEKIKELDIFSGISILCVVLIHSNSFYMSEILNFNSFAESCFSIKLLDNFVTASVAMFIFIAGYKYALNNLNDDYKKYVLKRIKRVIKPFLVISAIFLLKNIISYPDYFNLKTLIVEIIYIFLGYNIAYQLWYIPMYLFITCTYPIIYKIFKTDKTRIIFILFLVIIQYLLCLKFDILTQKPFNFIYYYLFYEMGVIFEKYNLKENTKNWSTIIIVLFVCSATLLAIKPMGDLYITFQRYLISPLAVISYYFISSKLIKSRLLDYLGKYSFYIFLLHAPVISYYVPCAFKYIGIYNSIIYVFITGALIIVVTMILYKIIEKTFIRKVFF